jgi:hypothetical protein
MGLPRHFLRKSSVIRRSKAEGRGKMSRTFLCSAILICLSGWLCPEAFAQTASTGTLTGMVTDPIGSVVSGAPITAVEESSEKLLRTTTDATGVYLLSELSPGTYRVTVENEGLSPVDRHRPWLYRTEVEVTTSRVTRLDISLHSQQEALVMCSCSMLDDTLEKLLRETSPPDPEIALHVSTDSGSVALGSEVWLTLTLTNIASHPILIPEEKGAIPAFEYQIGVSDPCNCPIGGTQVGRQKRNDSKGEHQSVKQPTDAPSEPMLRLPPGATLTDRIEVSKLLNLSEPRTYVIRVRRPDTAASATSERSDKQLFVMSNRISVTVTSPPKVSSQPIGMVTGKVTDALGAVTSIALTPPCRPGVSSWQH